MKQFIGKIISEVMVEHGRPNNVFKMPDGRKAYQFYWDVAPSRSAKQPREALNVIGNTDCYDSVTTGGGVNSSKGCLITYSTKSAANEKNETVVGIHYLDRLVC